jgi:uncharacterized protein (DUF433 family)
LAASKRGRRERILQSVLAGYAAFCYPSAAQIRGSTMPAQELLDRITSDPDVCGGRPCIRGMRIRVSDILEMLALGVTEAEILADFPDLEPEDIKACLMLAARRLDIPRVAA